MMLSFTRFTPVAVTMAALMAVGSPLAQAQSVTDISTSRGVGTNGLIIEPDGRRTTQEHTISFHAATGLFDETARIDLVGPTPDGPVRVTGHASQQSNIEFLAPNLLHLTGSMSIEVAVESLTDHNEYAPDALDAEGFSSSGFNFHMTTTQPVEYTFSGRVDIDGFREPGTPGDGSWFISETVFDHSDLPSNDFSGRVGPGEHRVSFFLDTGIFAFLPPGAIGQSADLEFDITARIIPTPAAIGPGLILFAGLLFRRRRLAEDV